MACDEITGACRSAVAPKLWTNGAKVCHTRRSAFPPKQVAWTGNDKRDERDLTMTYGHAERTLAAIRLLEAETRHLLGSTRLDPAHERWLRAAADSASRRLESERTGAQGSSAEADPLPSSDPIARDLGPSPQAARRHQAAGELAHGA